jgi:hypothetical protein
MLSDMQTDASCWQPKHVTIVQPGYPLVLAVTSVGIVVNQKKGDHKPIIVDRDVCDTNAQVKTDDIVQTGAG